MIRIKKGNGWRLALLLIGAVVLCTESAQSMLTSCISCLLVYPILRLQNLVVAPITAWHARTTNAHVLMTHLDIMQEENEQLKADVIRLQGLVDYSQEIHELASFAQQYDVQGPVVQILMKQLTSQGHFFWIDRGAHDGIAKDMVAVYKNHLVGRVVDVYPWYSKVQLVTDSGCKVAGYCAGTQVHGIHKGCNIDCNTVLTYVSHLEQLIVGDMVLSSGEGLIFPRGFLLGRIVSSKTDGLYQQVQLKTDVDMHALTHCMVLTKGNKSL
jgi:rod shape-determining protein MreC